ncbi:MAG: hypothetical protein IJJ33_12920 [Victivallales bacterium]|nr:hypothetical protein [Victivallales bacterium]
MTEQSQEEKLRQAILAEAQGEARRLVDRAKATARRAMEEARKQADAILASRQQEMSQEAEAATRAVDLEIQRRIHRIQIIRREECLDELFKRALEQCAAIGGPEHEQSLRQLAAEALRALGEDEIIVRFPTADSAIVTEGWLQSIAQEALPSGSNAVFRLQPSDTSAPGLYFETADGTRAFDNTYAARLRYNQEALRLLVTETSTAP